MKAVGDTHRLRLNDLYKLHNDAYESSTLEWSPVGQGSGLPNTYPSLGFILSTFLKLWSPLPLQKKKK